MIMASPTHPCVDVSVGLKHDLEPPAEFPFPFQPYDIQKDFMREVYTTLESGRIGIFESPTGTGKSLSLICGALKWLVDHEEHHKKKLEAVLSGSVSPSALCQKDSDSEGAHASIFAGTETKTANVPDWFTNYDKEKSRKDTVDKLKAELRQKTKHKERLKKLKQDGASVHWKAKRKREDSPVKAEIERLLAEGSKQGDHERDVESKDNDIIVAEYFSDEEQSTQLQLSSDDDEDFEEEHVRKIYYCSRTHTQLAQFVREVQHSPYSDSVHVITLASRQSLCINEEVRRLKPLTLLNDRCLEMQKNKKKDAEKQESKMEGSPKRRKKSAITSCPFYKPQPIENFRDLALAEVRDIEQLVTVGREIRACPYYGVRRAIPQAQLVLLPYNILLHAYTREAVGVKLKGNVVIIDEAHNLLDTISSVHSVEINGLHLSKALSQLSQYMQRYKSRLKAKNLMYIKQLLHILACFLKVLDNDPNRLCPVEKTTTDPPPSEPPSSGTDSSLKYVERCVAFNGVQSLGESSTELMRLNDFLLSANADNINFFKVLRYCAKSQVSKKLNGFVDRYLDPTVVGGPSQFNSPLMLIETFLQALTNCNKDGRIVVTKSGHLIRSSLKFLLLNPAVHFSSIVGEARAVIVAGGTMQPVSEFKDQLLFSAGVSPERILEFSCGHVIPPGNLLPICLCKGPSGGEFEFTYQLRNAPAMVDELGRTVVNLSFVVPGGLVCFFPSYDYEKRVHTHWETSGILEKIGRKKKVFREPKVASQVDSVLRQYAKCIEVSSGNQSGRDGHAGALMLCVVGGKLSEGINFSNDLGRCILMVGLPYPNLKSPELNEKIDYLNSTQSCCPDGRLPGQVHYENLCMKAVNQSIGRSIRHSRDYASILLMDKRYARTSVQRKLPEWIGSQLQVCEKFGPAFDSIRKFFLAKKKS